MADLSRREWLKLSAALGVTTWSQHALGMENPANPEDFATGFDVSRFGRSPELSSNQSAVVIGGGIAGMTAAFLLKKAGMKVTVLEKDTVIGGRMSHIHVDGHVVDRGAHIVTLAYETILGLLKELHMLTGLSPVSARSSIVRDGKHHHINLLQLQSVLASGLIRPNEILPNMRNVRGALALLCNFPKKIGDYRNFVDDDTQNAAEWARKSFGNWSVEYFLDPLTAGLFFQSPEETSKAFAAWNIIYMLKAKKTYTITEGMGALPQALGRDLDVRLGTEAASVETLGSEKGVRIVTNTGEELFADWCVLAAPAPISKKLYSNPLSVEAPLLNTRVAASVNLSVGVNRNWLNHRKLKDVYAVLCPRKERKLVGSITFESSKPARPLPPGTDLLQIYLDQNVAPEMMNWSQERILEAVTPEVERLLPGFTGSVTFAHAIRFPHIMPIFHPGHGKEIVRYRESPEVGENRILLAGDFTNISGTEGSAFSGRWAAEKILQKQS